MNEVTRRAKIVCTLGPASNTPEMIDRLVQAGLDVARLNFSHGAHETHAATIAAIREISGRYEQPVAILADLQGPKIRTGLLRDGKPVQLCDGQSLTITTRDVPGDERVISTNYTPLPEEVKAGDRILLADGLIELRVRSAAGSEVECDVVNGGELGQKKGINLPGVKMKIRAVTEKDQADLAFACERWGVGGARRPGRGDEPGESAGGAEADHRAGPRFPPAGDHRHADAGVHDAESAAHARGGVRRGECDF
jgi:pyruvate kinase